MQLYWSTGRAKNGATPGAAPLVANQWDAGLCQLAAAEQNQNLHGWSLQHMGPDAPTRHSTQQPTDKMPHWRQRTTVHK